MIDGLKPYPAMKDSGVRWLGEVPEHWEVRPVGGMGSLFKGNGGNKDDEVPAGIPCVRYGDLYTRHEFFITKSKAYVSQERSGAYTLIRHGDVLFAASGETEEDIGRSSVNLIEGEARCGGDVLVLRPEVPAVPRYLGYAADSPASRRQKACMGRGFTVVHIYGSQLKRLVFPLPPLPEQAAIVRFLDHADRRIRRYIRAKQKLIKLLEERVSARASEVMRHPRCTMQRLGRVATEYVRSIVREDAEIYVPLGLYNRGRGIFHKTPTLGADLGDSAFTWVEPGDLVVSGQFAWEGAVALASSAEKKRIVSHRYYLLRGVTDRATTPYLWALLRSDFGVMLLEQHSRGAAGRNRPLNLRTLLKEPVPVPPLEAQLSVNELLAANGPVHVHAARQIELLRQDRTRLIADVVTGKLDVREAAARLPDEVEEPEPLDEIEAAGDVDDTGVGEGDEVPDEAEA
jgi:type I restriction enzyme S subunit